MTRFYTRPITAQDDCWKAFGKRPSDTPSQDFIQFYSELPLVKDYDARLKEKVDAGYFLRVQELFEHSIEEHRHLLRLTCDAIIQWTDTRSLWFKRTVLSKTVSPIEFAQGLKNSVAYQKELRHISVYEKLTRLITTFAQLKEHSAIADTERRMAKWFYEVLIGIQDSWLKVEKERNVATLPPYIFTIINRYIVQHMVDDTSDESRWALYRVYTLPILAALRGQDLRPFFTHDAFSMTPEEYVAKRSNEAAVRATRAHLEAYLSPTTPSAGTVKRPGSPYRS